MLNTTAPIAAGPVPAVAAEGPQDGAGCAFAQALDQAEAQQREAGQADGAETTRRPDGRRTPARADALQRQTAAAADVVSGRAAAHEGDAAPEAAAPAESGDHSHAEVLSIDPTPLELSAWVSALPLPPPPAAPAAAPAGEAPVEATRPRAPRAAVAAAAPAITSEAAAAPEPDKGRATTAQPRAGNRNLSEPAGAQGPVMADTASPADPARPVTATHDGAMASTAAAAVGAQPSSLPAAAVAGHPTRSAEPGTPLLAELRAAVGSDQFAPALGARLSVLVRDGIEHAQLRLNPAELGPIEVRIDVDGPRAQVDFSAAHATTRQALQDAVPALASALRENGLTLTGGGVFEQPREQRGDTSPRDMRQTPASTDRGIGDTPPATAARGAPRARGVLDLYA